VIVKSRSPAKINLFLHITGKREDGYHDLFTLMTFLDLFDDLEFEFGKPRLSVVCDHPDVPGDESNLAFRAAVLFYENLSAAGIVEDTDDRVKITIRKKIPPGGGLGGGSSNAATVLAVLNRHHGRPFSVSFLKVMGLGLGADVPFFIHGSPAIAQGVGEKLEMCAPLKPYHVVLCFPGIQSSTARVYKNVDFILTNQRKSNNNALLNLCRAVRVLDIKEFLHNDLESEACRIYPDIGPVKEEMVGFLPDGVLMTGSGSSFYALFSDRSKAEHAFQELSSRWKNTCKLVFLTTFATAERLL